MCSEKNKVIIVTAPSGAGKTTLTNHLLETMDQLEFSVSATTREIREGEEEGVDYYFVSQEAFQKLIEDDEFVEWEEVYEGTFYGTLKKEVDRIWKMGKAAIFVVDIQGGLDLSRYFGDKALSIFIKPRDISQLRDRLKGRATESPDDLEERIMKARWELSQQDKFDVTILNDELEKAKQDMRSVVENFLK